MSAELNRSGRSTLDPGLSECPRPSTLDPRLKRRPWIAFFLLTPFLGSIIGAWAWFNTGFGTGLGLSTLDSRPRIWLEATTNIPGYTFIAEPVSDSVMEGLGTTNILSGTFVRNADMDSREPSVERPEQREDHANPLSRRSTLDTGRSTAALDATSTSRITVFLATWSAESEAPLSVLGHTPDICWVGAGWKPVRTENPQRVLIEIPIAKKQNSDVRRQMSEISEKITLVQTVNRPLTSCRSVLDSRLSTLDAPGLTSVSILDAGRSTLDVPRSVFARPALDSRPWTRFLLLSNSGLSKHLEPENGNSLLGVHWSVVEFFRMQKTPVMKAV